MACPTSQDCIAVGEDGLAEVSNNSGLSWYVEATGTNKRLLGISCVSSSACIAVGDKGTIIRTQDDGITWQRVRSGTSEGLTGISCANSTTYKMLNLGKEPLSNKLTPLCREVLPVILANLNTIYRAGVLSTWINILI